MTAKEMIKPEPMALQGKALELFVVQGDLAVLSPADKAKHYIALCESLGLNPATKPFEYIKLNGKERLYALKEASDQLRKLHGVSIEIVARNRHEDVYCVTARASTADGRKDESIGVVAIGSKKGEDLANALMKAETKAKRRVTLSICGLGFLDETELDGIIERERDNFAELAARTQPQEVKTDAELIAAKQANVITMPTAPKQEAKPEPAPKAKPAEGLPEIPEVIDFIPPEIVRAYYARLNGLLGAKLDKIGDDDLELVIEVMTNAYIARRATGKTSEHGLAWFQAIADRAASILNERNNPTPPVQG